MSKQKYTSRRLNGQGCKFELTGFVTCLHPSFIACYSLSMYEACIIHSTNENFEGQCRDKQSGRGFSQFSEIQLHRMKGFPIQNDI